MMKTDSSLIGRRVVVLKDVYYPTGVMMASIGEKGIINRFTKDQHLVEVWFDKHVGLFKPDELELCDEH